MTCPHALADGPLLCTRPVDHCGGHVYASSTGSWIADRHDATNGGEH